MSIKADDKQFIDTWMELQSGTQVAARLGMSVRAALSRRRKIEAQYKILLPVDDVRSPTYHRVHHSPRAEMVIENGTIIVASDAHYWPAEISAAHLALVELCKKLKPKLVVMNGDLFDGASVSRHPRIAWEGRPTVAQEIDTVSARLDEIKAAAKGAKRWWCMGNHDMRFESRLANTVPEFQGVAGFNLADHFPDWNFSMSLFINGSLMIKHRWRSGVHATWNNTLNSGVNMCTGHLHRLQATILTDYGGTRWGVDCGTLADPRHEHMDYAEDNPLNHCSGFAVLTIKDGQLLHPEFCHVIDDVPYFRGEEVAISWE